MAWHECTQAVVYHRCRSLCLGKFPKSADSLLDFLNSSLSLEAESPLTLQIAVNKDDIHAPTISKPLIDEGCLYLDPCRFILFSRRGVGKPTASRLHIHAGSDTDELSPLDFFAVVPRLRDVRSKDWSYRLLTLPWEQLLRLKYEHGEFGHLSVGFDAMPLLSTHAHFELYVEVEYIILPLVLQPKTSNIFAFTIEFDLYLASALAQQVLGTVFDSLTLPCLGRLSIRHKADLQPVPWEQQQFLAFATRSSLHDTLLCLSLRVLIEDDEFLACLSSLASLEELVVEDCVGEDSDHAVVTDTLLNCLSRTKRRVPQLDFLAITSLLRFSDDACAKFIDSRIIPGGYKNWVFEIQIYPLPEAQRKLSTEFLGEMVELEHRGELSFTVEQPEPVERGGSDLSHTDLVDD